MSGCVACTMPEGKFNVKLDKDDLCNYCNYWEENRERLSNFNSYKPFFDKRLEKIKGKYSYDALLGLSGGKDSTYVLYKMVKEYGCNVLVMTYDNGYLSDWAMESIKRTVNELGVDHFFYKPEKAIHKIFYKAALKKMGDPCLACAFAGYFYTIKFCMEKKIPLFIHGRSPFQMFRNLYEGSKDLFIPMLKANCEEHSFERLAEIYKPIHDNMEKWIYDIADSKEDAKAILNEFFLSSEQLNSDFVPEFFAYFMFHHYDEESMKSEIERELGWKKCDNDNLLGHYDCRIHEIAGKLYEDINKVNVLTPDLASMIRMQELTLEESQELIKKSNPSANELALSKRLLCEDLDIEEVEFDKMIENVIKRGSSKFESR